MLIWITLLLLVVIGILFFLKSRTASPVSEEGPWPFYARRLMSAPEQVLYFRLVEALPDRVVLAQVQLSRILGVQKGANQQSWLNRISRMSADFVICTRDATVVAVVELDDASHDRADRQAADAKKDKALASAGIPVVRWPVKAIPDAAAIRQVLASASTPHSSTGKLKP